ncbi:MAG: extracellular solute-binding protein [Candidatus Izimaplasma sp.]|nr:extracellular solute-binding protein [Candidatus Izimaplasma bacterium]
MKKVLIFLTVFSFILILTGCGGDDNGKIQCNDGYHEENGECVADEVNQGYPVFSGVEDLEITIGDSFDPLSDVTASDEEDGNLTSSIAISGTVDTDAVGIYTIEYTVTDSDSNVTTVERDVSVIGLDGCAVHYTLIDGTCIKNDPEVITILHGAVYEIDPFHEAYTGTDQLERQQLQEDVEAQYNVIINYENYSSSAAWGPARTQAIINASVAGDPLGDIYWVTSDWIQELVKGNAVANVTPYLNTVGQNIDQAWHDIGEYQDAVYGFESYKPSIDTGLYYNADLIDSLGVENPSDLYLDGQWNWSKFEAWATQVQTALSGQPDDMYALGGMFSYYANAMTTLNGGSLINKQTERVAFAQNPALETYDFLTTLHEKGLFEPSPQYDSGSALWQTGKVAMHPGSLWFLTAENRWGTLEFEIGFVPYPAADDYQDDYISPINGVAIMTMASGMEPDREALVFEVWNELQLWKSDTEADTDFATVLMTKFDEQKYIDAYIDVYDKVYLDLINAIGIGAYSENGWARNINIAIREGNARTTVDTIKPIYEAALLDYLGD